VRPKWQYQEDNEHKEESQDWDNSEDEEYSDEEFVGDTYRLTTTWWSWDFDLGKLYWSTGCNSKLAHQKIDAWHVVWSIAYASLMIDFTDIGPVIESAGQSSCAASTPSFAMSHRPRKSVHGNIMMKMYSK
jgi:hypothetical protein